VVKKQWRVQLWMEQQQHREVIATEKSGNKPAVNSDSNKW